MKKDVYEITDPQQLLDTKGVWRVVISEASAKWLEEDQKYELGEVVEFTVKRYVDAERAGVCGYFPKTLTIPACVLVEAAEAYKTGQIPKI